MMVKTDVLQLSEDQQPQLLPLPQTQQTGYFSDLMQIYVRIKKFLKVNLFL